MMIKDVSWKSSHTGKVSPPSIIPSTGLYRRIPRLDEYQRLRRGMSCSTIIVARDSDFRDVVKITEAYVAASDIWVGEYPYLNRNSYIKFSEKILSRPSDEEEVDYQVCYLSLTHISWSYLHTTFYLETA
jgi:hypothetical protein